MNALMKSCLAFFLGAALTTGAYSSTDGNVAYDRNGTAATAVQPERKAGQSAKALRMVPTLRNDGLRNQQRPSVKPRYTPKTDAPKSRITSAQSGRIYGGAIYADNWTTSYQPVGIYSFEKNDGSSISEVKVGDDYVVTGGGFFANGKYYFVSYMEFFGFILADFYTVDFETWEIERDLPVEVGAVAQDMAFDPTTGNVYGCFLNDEGDGWVFGLLEIESGKRTKLCDLDIIILSVGVNSKGEVYGVGLDGNFYRFDKHTGAKTLIGATGRTPVYSASGCFDLKTDTFYWQCIEADSKANIYTVDLQTGLASYVTTLVNNVEMTGMFIPTADAEDDAPAAISDLTLDFPEGSRSGTISFTVPKATFNSGKDLSGILEWYVTVDETELANGKAAPGEKVTVDYSAPTAGNIRIGAYTVNEAGSSPRANASVWVGNDAPVAVGNLTVSSPAPGEFILSWDAPQGTVHGGYMDPAGITYDVVRMPGEVKVSNGQTATSFKESFDVDGDLELHSYIVVPIFADEQGQPTESRRFATGSQGLPYRTYFDTDEDFEYFTVEDTNSDGVTWEYDPIYQAARIKYSFSLVGDGGYDTPDMDDWFFSPALRLQAGRMIRVGVDSRAYAGTYGASYTERFEIKLGKTPSSDAMTQQVIGVTNVTNTDLRPYEGYTSVDEDGIYYIGVHGCSPRDQLYLYIDNYSIEDGPLLGTPGEVTNFKVTPGSKGALQASLAFTAPTQTVEGTALTDLTEIRISRNGKVISTIQNPAPGAALTYQDDEAVQGDNTYTLQAFNTIGEGYAVSKTVFVGYDRPGLPQNVKAVEKDGKIVITWQAPFEGENGGYHDPAALKYTVLRANDEEELAAGITELTFTDVPPLNGYHHDFFTYYIFAESPAGYGYGVASNSVCTGGTFEVPFVESFPAGRLSCGPWDVQIPEESYGYWQMVAEGQYPTAYPQDNDGGMVTFIPEEEGDSGRLISGKISMKNVQSPTLDFWYYAYPGVSDKINVYVNADDKGEKLVEGVSIGSGRTEGWTKASIDLSAYSSAGLVQIIFNAISSEAYNNIHLDNISVRETYDNNLAVTGISVPSRMMATERSTVTVELSNLGLNSISDYTLELYRDGKLEKSEKPGRITSGSVIKVDFEVIPTPVWGTGAVISAKVACAIDENPDDDMSQEVRVVVTDLNFPAVTDLTASRGDDGSVSLEWNEPDFVAGKAQTVIEDVEDIKAFSIDNLGDWTVIDGDGKETYGINNAGTGNMLMYENAGKPMAFMAFNPSKAGVPVEYSDGTPTDWAPYSGDQYFAAFSVNGKNDDWIISPLLPGIEQEISFRVRSVTADYGFERYEVYYSTSGIDREDFRMIGDLRTAPVAWVEDTATLPEGTRYFAIRCVSEDCYVFMLDDIKFKTADAYMGELSLMGYNVYRDLELLTPTPVMEQTFVDPSADMQAHVYNVTVVYDLGESRLSNDATVGDSKVNQFAHDGFAVETGTGFMKVTAMQGIQIDIFTAGGVKISSFLSSGSDEISLPAGVYLVKTSAYPTVKALVR